MEPLLLIKKPQETFAKIKFYWSFNVLKTAFFTILKFLLIPGEFYAPEQPGARVLSLSSDQPDNTILVSGDTSGWLQIWDISHYALDVQHEVSWCEIKTTKKTSNTWTQCLLFPHSQSVNGLRCCGVGRRMREE